MKLFFVSVILIAVLAACSASRPTTYFVLNDLGGSKGSSKGGSNESQVSAASSRVNLELGPLTLPGYLDRKGIVYRIAANSLYVSDLNHWAEKLDDNMLRVLRSGLERCSAFSQVEIYPFRGELSQKDQLKIEVLRFERDADLTVRLDARIEWSSTRQGASSRHKDFSLQQDCRQGVEVEAMVECMNAVLGDFGQALCEMAGAG